jgi:hypothetical protein
MLPGCLVLAADDPSQAIDIAVSGLVAKVQVHIIAVGARDGRTFGDSVL